MGNKVSSADERVSDCFPAEVLGKIAMDEKLPAADSRVGVGRKRGGIGKPDIKKLRRELDQAWEDIPRQAQRRIAVHQQCSLRRELDQAWEDIPRPKAQRRTAVHQQSSSVVQTYYANSGAVQGIGKKAKSHIQAYFSEYKNFDRPITDGSTELAQFLKVFEPWKTAKRKPNYSNRRLSQLDDIFAKTKIEYDQWKLQQKYKFQQETRGCQAIVPKRSETEQLKMEGKECKDKIRGLTVRLQQDVDCQSQVRELMKNLDAQKEKMDGVKTNWPDLASSIAGVLVSAISIAVPFFCPSLAPVWLTVIQIACAIAPCLLCKILPKMWNWVKDFLKELRQKIKSSKS